MQIEKISRQNIKNRKLPAQAIIVQLLDRDSNHLAFVSYNYERNFQYLSADGEYEESQLNEELSDIENEMLSVCFKVDKDLEEKFGGWTGGLIVTDENSKIILHERPAR